VKAFLLAAGKGTRLRPLTDRLPKCLVPIGGKPLLGIWLDLLAAHGVTSVLVNTHHLAEQVEEFVRRRARGIPDVVLFRETELLGSAGTVAANRSFVEGEARFLVAYADNLTDVDLSDMVRFHDRSGSEFTVGVFRTPDPRSCGILLTDAQGRVVAFDEKPANPRGDWANAGIYVAGPSLFPVLSEGAVPAPYDFGCHVLPRLVGRMRAYRIGGLLMDTGTPERLAAARRAWELKTGAPAPGSGKEVGPCS
jgi:mannose-1-phosphate guanylyltransferase